MSCDMLKNGVDASVFAKKHHVHTVIFATRSKKQRK